MSRWRLTASRVSLLASCGLSRRFPDGPPGRLILKLGLGFRVKGFGVRRLRLGRSSLRFTGWAFEPLRRKVVLGLPKLAFCTIPFEFQKDIIGVTTRTYKKVGLHVKSYVLHSLILTLIQSYFLNGKLLTQS